MNRQVSINGHLYTMEEISQMEMEYRQSKVLSENPCTEDIPEEGTRAPDIEGILGWMWEQYAEMCENGEVESAHNFMRLTLWGIDRTREVLDEQTDDQ